jgi:malate permease and related proteins
MSIFFVLIAKILPLYALMILGYYCGRYLNIKKESVAYILLYILVPGVFFTSIATTTISVNLITLPFLFFIIASIIALIFLTIGKKVLKGPIAHILGQTAGVGNYGYFALPVAIAVLGEKSEALIVLCGIGLILYENTLAYYIIASGKFSPKESIMKLLKLPALYAVLLALILQFLNIKVPKDLLDFGANFRGGFTILGSLLVGLSLSDMKLNKHSFDWTYTALAFFAKHIIWPLLIALVIFLDLHYFHIYDSLTHKVMILMSVTPLAVNTIIYAIQLKEDPQKISAAVVLSTMLALFITPIVAIFFF